MFDVKTIKSMAKARGLVVEETEDGLEIKGDEDKVKDLLDEVGADDVAVTPATEPATEEPAEEPEVEEPETMTLELPEAPLASSELEVTPDVVKAVLPVVPDLVEPNSDGVVEPDVVLGTATDTDDQTLSVDLGELVSDPEEGLPETSEDTPEVQIVDNDDAGEQEPEVSAPVAAPEVTPEPEDNEEPEVEEPAAESMVTGPTGDLNRDPADNKVQPAVRVSDAKKYLSSIKSVEIVGAAKLRDTVATVDMSGAVDKLLATSSPTEIKDVISEALKIVSKKMKKKECDTATDKKEAKGKK